MNMHAAAAGKISADVARPAGLMAIVRAVASAKDAVYEAIRRSMPVDDHMAEQYFRERNIAQYRY